MSKEESKEENDIKVWNRLDQMTDRLFYYGNGLESLTRSMEMYSGWLHEMRFDDLDTVRQLENKLMTFVKRRDGIPEEVSLRYDEALKRLLEKLEWTPDKVRRNPGYAGYMDMMLRYQDLRERLDHLTPMVKNNPKWIENLARENNLMSQMNEKLDELSYRANLVDVSKTVSKRVIKDDPLAALFALPSFMVGIIFHPTTSTKYASKLLRLCKRSLALSEAVQYERNNASHPVVTMSGVLKNPPQKKSVPSLYEHIVSPEPADTTRSLVAPENGEVCAPTELSVPIAKDSSTTVDSKVPLVPMSKRSEDGKNASSSQ